VTDLRAQLPSALQRSHIKHFGVVTTSDFTTFRFKTPCVYIVYFNGHFYSVYIERDSKGRKYAELFCSLGKNPVKDYQLKIGNLRKYKYNTRQLQHSLSSRCSLFCLYFCALKGRGYAFGSILGKFSNSTRINEVLVSVFYRNLEKPYFIPLPAFSENANA